MAQRTDFSVQTNLGNVADPTLAQDAATKNYVDARPGGSTNFDSPIFTNTNLVIFGSETAGTAFITVAGNVTGSFAVNDVLSFSNLLPTPFYTVRLVNFTGGNTQISFTTNLVYPVVNNQAIYKVTTARTPYADLAVGGGLIGSVASSILTLDTYSTGSPFLQFVGNATGGANQTFTSNSLANYSSNASLATVMVNGVVISPITSYIISTNTLTVSDYLNPNAVVQVIYKSPGGGPIGGSGVTSLNGLQGTIALASPSNSLTVSANAQNINVDVNISKLVENLTPVTATTGALSVDVSIYSAFITSNLFGTTILTVNNIGAVLTANNQAFTFVIISNQTAATNFIDLVSIPGGTVNLRWASNITPAAGTAAGGIDLYRFTVIRTAANVYSVIAAQLRN